MTTKITKASTIPDPKTDPVGYAFHMLHEIDHHLAGAKSGTMFMEARNYAQEAIDKLRPVIVRESAIRARAKAFKAKVAACSHTARANGACVLCGVIPNDTSESLETALTATEKGYRRDRPANWDLQVDETGVVHAVVQGVLTLTGDHYSVANVTAERIEQALRSTTAAWTHDTLGAALTAAGLPVRFYEQVGGGG